MPHIPSPKHFSLDVKVGSVAPGPTSKVVIQRCTCLGLLKYALKPRLDTLQMKSEQIYLRLQSKWKCSFLSFCLLIIALRDLGEVKMILFCQDGGCMSVGHAFVWDIAKNMTTWHKYIIVRML